MTAKPDPFTVEVIRNALTAIAEEMSLVIMRSARSPPRPRPPPGGVPRVACMEERYESLWGSASSSRQ